MPNKIEHKIIDGLEYKLCSKCKNWILLNNFYKNKLMWDGIFNLCIKCTKIINKEIYSKNRNSIIDRVRKYYKENKELVNNSNKKYYENHREEILSYKSWWQRKNKDRRNKQLFDRYHNEPNYKIAVTLRTRVLKAIGNNQKSGSTLEILGCSIDFFKTYMESKFESGMSWDNHGDMWHIDHIKPCSSFDLSNDKEQMACFHYTNMQPLFVQDNLSKGNKLI